MTDTAIRAALEGRAAAAAGWPASAWAKENAAFQPTRGVPWVRTAILWGAEDLESIPAAGGTVVRVGTFSIEYFGAVDTTSAAADTFVEAVRAAFPVGAFVPVAGGIYLRVDRVRRWPADRDDRNWLHQPLDVEWTVRYNNPTTL